MKTILGLIFFVMLCWHIREGFCWLYAVMLELGWIDEVDDFDDDLWMI